MHKMYWSNRCVNTETHHKHKMYVVKPMDAMYWSSRGVHVSVRAMCGCIGQTPTRKYVGRADVHAKRSERGQTDAWLYGQTVYFSIVVNKRGQTEVQRSDRGQTDVVIKPIHEHTCQTDAQTYWSNRWKHTVQIDAKHTSQTDAKHTGQTDS